jgi:hypothetical protein
MARKKRTSPTLAEVAYANAGIRQGMSAVHFMLYWGLAEAEWGHGPSLEEYCESHGVDRATFYRHQAAFRKAFPDEENPTRLNVATGNQVRYVELVKSVRSLASSVVQVQAMLFSVGAAPIPDPGGAPA